MLRRSCVLLARRGRPSKEADAFLAKLSVTESFAKPMRNNRDSETSLSNKNPSKEAELELMKDCIKGLKELLDGIEDDHYWRR